MKQDDTPSSRTLFAALMFGLLIINAFVLFALLFGLAGAGSADVIQLIVYITIVGLWLIGSYKMTRKAMIQRTVRSALFAYTPTISLIVIYTAGFLVALNVSF